MAGLYIHIPFCAAKCAYCDFYSGPLRLFDAETYARALLCELNTRRHEVGQISTVYIGGGTPSTVPPRLLAPFLNLASGERTVEVNPEDVTPEYAEALLRAGANRVSMGVQSLSDAELRKVGRRHSAEQAVKAYHTLRSAGFTNISLDLIFGLPGQSLESWLDSLHKVLDLKPEHLSAYMLSYEPGTRLYAMLQKGVVNETDEDTLCEMYTRLCKAASHAGLLHYEISNFAQPSFEAQHNSAYWDMTPYLGLGPGAHSFDGHSRRYVPPSLKAYLEAPAEAAVIEPESPTEQHNDLVMTALRTARGLDPAMLTPTELAAAKRTLITTSNGRLRIAEPDWLRANTLILPLLR